jgi:nickel-dependent lactate racemase
VLRHAADARLASASPTRKLPEDLQQRIAVQVHDAANREQLCMLNVSRHDSAIYLNRSLVEADVVVPFGVTRPVDSLGYLGVSSALFPAFADEATQQRFLAPKSSLSERQKLHRIDEAQEAHWLLGVQLVVQVIPGPGESLMHIVAGDTARVDRASRELCDNAWHCEVPRRAHLVLATLSGGRQQQSWSNFARVLDAALRVVEDGGTIAVLCDLKAKLGPSLRRLARASSLDDANLAIERDQTPDALAAMQLIRTLRRAKIYLLSRLDEERVESLGLAYVASAEEIARLASRAASCMLLQNAQQVIPCVTEEVLS